MSKKTDHTSSFVCDICTLSAVTCQIKLFQFELCIFKIVFLKKWLEVHQHQKSCDSDSPLWYIKHFLIDDNMVVMSPLEHTINVNVLLLSNIV